MKNQKLKIIFWFVNIYLGKTTKHCNLTSSAQLNLMRDNLTNVNEDLECYCKTYKANNDDNNNASDVRKVFEHLNKHLNKSSLMFWWWDGSQRSSCTDYGENKLSEYSHHPQLSAGTLVSVFVPVLHLIKKKWK